MIIRRNMNKFFLPIFLGFFISFNAIEANGDCDTPGSTEPGNADYSDCFLITISFDPPLPAPPNNKVAPGSSHNIIVTHKGDPPPDWSINWSLGGAGQDFELQFPHTTDNTNVLDVGPDACGVAEIIVSDNHSGTCFKIVRSTQGKWVEVMEDRCILWSGEHGCTIYFDEDKWVHRLWCLSDDQEPCPEPPKCQKRYVAEGTCGDNYPDETLVCCYTRHWQWRCGGSQ